MARKNVVIVLVGLAVWGCSHPQRVFQCGSAVTITIDLSKTDSASVWASLTYPEADTYLIHPATFTFTTDSTTTQQWTFSSAVHRSTFGLGFGGVTGTYRVVITRADAWRATISGYMAGDSLVLAQRGLKRTVCHLQHKGV